MVSKSWPISILCVNSPRKPVLVQAFGKRGRACRKSVSEHSYSASCREHMYYLMLCRNVWNMRGIMEVNEHIQRALSLLSLPQGPFLHYFRAFGRERSKYKLPGWLTEGSFSLLADLDSLRLICPVNFLSYKPRQRCPTASVEREHERTVSYVMHGNERIIHCAIGLGDLLFALVLQSLLKVEIRALLRWYWYRIIALKISAVICHFVFANETYVRNLNSHFACLGECYLLRINNVATSTFDWSTSSIKLL